MIVSLKKEANKQVTTHTKIWTQTRKQTEAYAQWGHIKFIPNCPRLNEVGENKRSICFTNLIIMTTIHLFKELKVE